MGVSIPVGPFGIFLVGGHYENGFYAATLRLVGFVAVFPRDYLVRVKTDVKLAIETKAVEYADFFGIAEIVVECDAFANFGKVLVCHVVSAFWE
jgi:hypothetical protein